MVDENRGHRTEMLAAFEDVGKQLRAEKPETIVMLNARWHAMSPFLVDIGKRHRTITDYSGFGVEVRYDCPGNAALGRVLVEAGQKAGLHVAGAERGVDSGVTVPMHLLMPNRRMVVVPLGIADFDAATCRRWGAIVRRVLDADPQRVAFVVAGMLSNDEHAWKLQRDIPEAGEFDEAALQALQEGAWDNYPSERRLVSKAKPQAGLRHLEVLRGFLGHDARGTLRSYESGYGLGAALVEFPVQAGNLLTSSGED